MVAKYKLLKKEVFVPPIIGWDSKMPWRRVQALIDIPLHQVKAGDIGGYVQSKKNLSQEGSCWIGGDAFVHGYAYITEDAHVTDNAQVVSTMNDRSIYIKDRAVISGTALIYSIKGDKDSDEAWKSIISGDVKIADNAKLYNVKNINDSAIICDNAKIFSSTVNGDSEISGDSVVYDKSTITSSKISGNSVVNKDATIRNVVLLGDAQIGAGQSFTEGVFEQAGIFFKKNPDLPKIVVNQDSDLQVVSTGNEKNSHRILTSDQVSTDDFSEIQLFHEIKGKIESYETDIIKIIRYPAMTDRTDHYTVKMTTAFNQANRLTGNSDSINFKTCVHDLEEKFLAAESNAIKISSSLLSKDQLRKSAKAKDLFSIASDEAAGEHERKVAFIQGFKQLEGIITVPEVAVDAFRVKLGFKELNM